MEGFTIDEMKIRERNERFVEEYAATHQRHYEYWLTVRDQQELDEITARCPMQVVDTFQGEDGIRVHVSAPHDMYLLLCQTIAFLPRGKQILDTVDGEIETEDRAQCASPGPWTVQAVSRKRVSGKPYVSYAIRDRRNCCLAVVGVVDAITDDGEGWANARLMRAAPELAAHLLRLKMDRTLVTDETFWEQVDALFARINTGVEVKGLR